MRFLLIGWPRTDLFAILAIAKGRLMKQLLGIAAIFIFSLQSLAAPILIAHRGASDLAPEATSLAFELAARYRADYLEFDLQRTKDGVIVAYHDDDLLRTTNVLEVFPEWTGKRPRIVDLTYKQLLQLDLGTWFNQVKPHRARPEYVGARIMRLDEILKLAAQQMQRPAVYVEFKNPEWYPKIEAQALEIFRQMRWLNPQNELEAKRQIIFQSFTLETLDRLRTLAPTIRRTYLVWDPQGHGQRTNWDSPQKWRPLLLKAYRGDHAIIGPDFPLALSPEFQRRRKEFGLEVHVWTVNDMYWPARYPGLVDAIFTDRIQDFVPSTCELSLSSSTP